MLSSKRTFWKDKTKSSRKGPFLAIQFCIYTPTTVEFLDRGQTEHKNSLTLANKDPGARHHASQTLDLVVLLGTACKSAP